MSYQQLLQRLAERLQEPLPGKEAQRKMAASARHWNPSQYKPNGQTKEGGVMILLYPHQEELFLPLILRPKSEKGVHSGQVAFPGGRREQSDTDIAFTALRECEEEIGVAHQQVQLIGQLSPLFVFASNFMVYPTIGFLPEKPLFKPNASEVAEVLEVGLSHLLNPNTQKLTNIYINENLTLEAPYFDVAGQVVWGATAMMLSELREVLEEIKIYQD
jgi:8-oxo-dGTP pyrophosphatase MutT (NUDIX family)